MTVQTAPVRKLPDSEIAALGRLIDNDLYRGRVEGAKEHILKLSRAHARAGVDIVCLACTELGLAFFYFAADAFTCDDLPRFRRSSSAATKVDEEQ